jgi:hypothetical protein
MTTIRPVSAIHQAGAAVQLHKARCEARPAGRSGLGSTLVGSEEEDLWNLMGLNRNLYLYYIHIYKYIESIYIYDYIRIIWDLMEYNIMILQ